MNKIFFAILILGITSCKHKQVPSSITQYTSVRDFDTNGLDIDQKILSQIEQEVNKKCEPFKREVWKYEKNGEEQHYILDTGIVFKFIDQERAFQIFEKFHESVLKEKNYLFLTNMDFDESYNSHYDIVIMNRTDPYDLISLIGTDGINYDLHNNDIIKKLKEWDEIVGFTFQVIDKARIHAFMEKAPKDIASFAAEVYAFCPDVIDQGYDSMEQMLSDYDNHKYFWLWWD